MAESDIPSISAVELKALRDNAALHELIDVREPTEWDIVCIDGAHLMPKAPSLAREIAARFGKDTPLILHCKSGQRSRAVLLELQNLGLGNVRNLDGGILAWVRDVDTTLPSY